MAKVDGSSDCRSPAAFRYAGVLRASLLVFSLFALGAHGAGQETWKAQADRANAALQRGDVESARSGYRRLVESLDAVTGPAEDAAHYYDQAAMFHRHVGDFDDAERLFRKAISGLEAAGQRGSWNHSQTIANLAGLYALQRRLPEAESAYLAAIGAMTASNGAMSLDTANLKVLLAELYREMQRNEEALYYYGEAIRAYGEHPGVGREWVVRIASGLGTAYLEVDEPALAVEWLTSALELLEGMEDPPSGPLRGALEQLAAAHQRAGNPELAESLLRRAVQSMVDRVGRDSIWHAVSLIRLANLLLDQGRRDETRPLLEEARSILSMPGNLDHPDTVDWLVRLGRCYLRIPDYAATVEVFVRAREAAGTNAGSSEFYLAIIASDLAAVNERRGRFDQAIAWYREALSVMTKAKGSDDADVAQVHENLGKLLSRLGRFADSERHLAAALAIEERVFGSDNPNTAASRLAVANLHLIRGDTVAADALIDRALRSLERSPGGAYRLETAMALSLLARVHAEERRFDRAERLYVRARDLLDSIPSVASATRASLLTGIASAHRLAGRHQQALAGFEEALALERASSDPSSMVVAAALNDLATAANDLGDRDRAEELYRESIDTSSRIEVGETDVHVRARFNLASLLLDRGAVDEALEHLHAALAWWQDNQPGNLPLIGFLHDQISRGYEATGRLRDALEHSRVAVEAHRQAVTRRDPDAIAVNPERQPYRATFYHHVRLAATLVDRAEFAADRDSMIDAAFQSAQLKGLSTTGAAISRMAARFAARDDDLGRSIRRIQQLDLEIRALNGILLDALASADGREKAQQVRADLDQLRERRATLSRRIDAGFPAYRNLVDPEPLNVATVQSLLAPGEVLAKFLLARDASHAWLVTPNAVHAYVIDAPWSELDELLQRLRADLDPIGFGSTPITPFRARNAWRLFQLLFGPVGEEVQAARRLVVVPEGPLFGLPPGVLITEPPESATLRNAGALRATKWLGASHAIMVLPSVPALRSLREIADAPAGTGFIGFGDPLLGAPGNAARGLRSGAFLDSYGQIAIGARLKQLPSLPETRSELQTMAAALGTGGGTIWLGDQATESRLKDLDLGDARYLAFATHGLLAGEGGFSDEPALVMTPPDEPSVRDDGLLTASEIAQLQLDADWVILSACNTAAGDSGDASGLSGLARAFFHAGSRALLVSHWPVSSAAATRLVASTFGHFTGPASTGRAEALRRARVGMIGDSDAPHLAHPAYWAAFSVVGEGGD